jgi:hypothetical protein
MKRNFIFRFLILCAELFALTGGSSPVLPALLPDKTVNTSAHGSKVHRIRLFNCSRTANVSDDESDFSERAVTPLLRHGTKLFCWRSSPWALRQFSVRELMAIRLALFTTRSPSCPGCLQFRG